MSVINIIARFTGTDVQTGLDRLDAQAQKFSANLGKNLSGGALSSLLTSLAAGFGALQLKEGLVNSFRAVADDAERAAEASERIKNAVNSSIRGNTNAEGVLINKKSDVAGDKAALDQVNGRLSAFIEKYGIDYRNANPVMGALHSWMHPGARDYFNGLVGERANLQAGIQQASGEIPAEQRAILRANRLAGYENARASDERDVLLGHLSQAGAQKRESERLSQEYNATVLDPTKSHAEREAARAAADRADNALLPIQFRNDFNRMQGINPQISANSLARIGGGGNVNVFGGREGALEIEAKNHTALLKEIARNTVKGEGGQNGDVN